MKTNIEASRKNGKVVPEVAEMPTAFGEAVVVAEVTNGRVYEVMRTSEGLKACPVEDLDRPNKWVGTVSLRAFVTGLADDKFFRVQTTSYPNDAKPLLERNFHGRVCFLDSKFDLVCTGSSRIETPAPEVKNFGHLGVKSS